jgi:hypothetical protein
LALLGSKPFGILVSACRANVRVIAEPIKADIATMNTIRIAFTRSGTREEDILRINASILSAFEVGSVEAMASFFTYNSHGRNWTFREAFIPTIAARSVWFPVLTAKLIMQQRVLPTK